MGKKSKSSGQKIANDSPPADNVYDINDRVTKDGLDLSHYRFSATNMMLGLDPMVPTSKTKKILADRAKAQREKPMDSCTQTDEEPPAWPVSGALPVDSSSDASEPETSKSKFIEAQECKSDQTKLAKEAESDTQSSAADSSSCAESSSGAESSAGPEGPQIAEAASQGDEASTNDASIDAVTDAPETSVKSVTFAVGTNDPAASPPTLDGPFMPISTTRVTDWSMSEDAMIVSMKEQSASWNLIADSIQRTRAQVRKRYYELKINQAHETANHEEAARVWNENQPNEAGSNAAASSEAGTGASANSSGYEDCYAFIEESEDESSLNFDEVEDDEASSGDLHLDLLREDDWNSSSVTDDDDGYDASDYDPFADPADPIADERYRRRAERFISRRTHAALFPGDSSSHEALVNQGFSKRDRALLEELHDRRIARQWLEMQANFFNVTGRMIPLHLIKAKLENNSPREGQIGYLARGERNVASWNDSVAHGAELLDPAEAKERPVDALSDSDESDKESDDSSDDSSEW